MAQPVKYTQTFVPTDFGAVGQLSGLYSQDVARRNQMYNQSLNSSMQALGEIGAVPTFDVEGRQQRLDEVGKAMDEAVAKKGGDYAAATRDLMRIVAMERSNPWYQLNARQQQAAEDRRKLSMDADNLVVGADPSQLSIQEAQELLSQGVDPFKQSALSRKDVYARSKDMASNYADLIMNSPEYFLNSDLGGQYWSKVAQYGFNDENIDQFINSGEGSKIVQSMVDSYPELGQANENQLREVVKQGLRSAIGKTQAGELANQAFMTARDLAYIAGQQGKGGSSSPLRKAGELSIPFSPEFATQTKAFDQEAVNLAKGTPLEGKVKSYQDLLNLSRETESITHPITTPSASGGRGNLSTSLTGDAVTASQLLENISSTHSEGMAIPSYNLDPLSTTDSTEANKIVNLQKVFDNEIKQKVKAEKLKPINKQDERALKDFDWDEDFSFDEVAFDANSGIGYTDSQGNPQETSGYGTGFIMKLVGTDKDGDPTEVMVRLPRTKDNVNLEFSLAAWLRNFDPSFNDVYMKDAAITWNR